MFFDKILEAFKLENPSPEIRKNSNISNQINSNYNRQSYLLKNYWMTNINNIYAQFKYRDASFKEMKEYALIDILSCFSNSARNPNNFSFTLLSELGITNWNVYFNSLVKNDYVRPANISEVLSADYTVNDLKILADSIGVIKKGRKSDLVERIAQSLSHEETLQILEDSNLYSISQKGIQILSGNEDYNLLHKYRHVISLAEFNDNRFPNGSHRRNPYDTVFQALSNRLFFYESSRNWGMICITHLNIYRLLIEESKKNCHTPHYDIILQHYLEYLYLSTCFASSICCAVREKIFSHNLDIFVLPQLDISIYRLADYEATINYQLVFCNKPPSLLTNEEFISLVHELFNSPMFDKGKWDRLLQNRACDFFRTI